MSRAGLAITTLLCAAALALAALAPLPRHAPARHHARPVWSCGQEGGLPGC